MWLGSVDMQTGPLTRALSRHDRARHIVFVLVLTAVAATFLVGASVRAQAPAAASPGKAARGATAGRGAASSTAPKVVANMLQLMRGIPYPASNVIFAAQDDLGKQPKVSDPSVSPNPLTSTYGGWMAVENAGMALVEAANLIAMPGRMCSNGRPAPVQRADWIQFTPKLRDAGTAAYKAAQAKSTDQIVDVAGTVSDACAACHDVYREKKNGVQDRCLP
jgi:hypothetical protein